MFAFVGLQAIAIYVNPNGNDAASGTQSAPVRSIQRAQALVHTARNNTSTMPAQIVLAGGDYYLPSTLTINSLDSNTEFLSDGTATLHGEIKVAGWKNTPTDALYSRFTSAARSNIVMADLNGQLTSAQLSAVDNASNVPLVGLLDNGALQDLAQFPAPGSWLTTGNNSNSTSLYWNSSEPTKWSSSNAPWAKGYFTTDYGFLSCPFTSINPGASTGQLGGKFPQGATSGSRFCFINVPEELDQAGEWYLDRKTNHIYVWPKNAGDLNHLTLSVNTGALVNVSGTQDVQFTKINFQGGMGDGIQVSSSNNFSIEDCSINGFANEGVKMDNTTNSTILRTHLSYIGNTAIDLNTGNASKLQKANNTVSDCNIEKYGLRTRSYSPGVWMKGCGNLVTHNTIANSPSNAVLVDGPWQTITYNSIHDVCTELSDAGAIYMGREPLSRGTWIEGNYFKDVYLRIQANPRTAGMMVNVYMDGMFTGATVLGNIMDHATFGVMVGGGRDNTVKYNVLVNGVYAYFVDARGVTRQAVHDAINYGGSWHYFDDIKAALSSSNIFQLAFPNIVDVLTNNPFFPVRAKASYNVAGNAQLLKLDGLTTSQLENINNVSIGTSGNLTQAMAALPAGYTLTPLSQIGPRGGSSGGPTNGTGTGLLGKYYGGKPDIGGTPTATRVDPLINFADSSGAPVMSGVGPNNFGVQWVGQVQAKSSGTYTFTTSSDDGVRLYVNGQLLVNNWSTHTAVLNQGTITLQAGVKYSIFLNYFQGGGGREMKLFWSAPGLPQELVPTSQLYPASS